MLKHYRSFPWFTITMKAAESAPSTSSAHLQSPLPKLSPTKSHNSFLPPNATAQLQRVFDYFDENGDGKISPAELQSCVTSVGGQLSTAEAHAAIVSCDTDGDGLLGFRDFQTLMEGHDSEEERKNDLQQAFRMYETEPGSGRITPTSLKRMLGKLGEPRTIDDCKAMIRTFDLNGDGVLNFHEFATMMR